MAQAVSQSDGLSFAQLREAYILAGQHAFDRDNQITGSDLLNGIKLLRDGGKLVSDSKRCLGFSDTKNRRTKPVFNNGDSPEESDL